MEARDDLERVYRDLIAALEEAKKNAEPELVAAVENWAKSVAEKAKRNLSRPRWLLTSSISEKVVDYKKNARIWAIAGFEKTNGGKRTPGTYGQYHEAGWAPDRKKPSGPDHFLRKAKNEQREQLGKDVDEALEHVLEVFQKIQKRS